MNISIEIDDALLAGVDHAVGVREISRSQALSEALKLWVAQQPKSSKWNIDWSKWACDPEFPDFGMLRNDQV
jgi:hypothetical protein